MSSILGSICKSTYALRCHHKLIWLWTKLGLKRTCSQVFLPLFIDLKEYRFVFFRRQSRKLLAWNDVDETIFAFGSPRSKSLCSRSDPNFRDQKSNARNRQSRFLHIWMKDSLTFWLFNFDLRRQILEKALKNFFDVSVGKNPTRCFWNSFLSASFLYRLFRLRWV